ncbi:MAG: DUF1573 domain-containing protein [Desulfobulbaceae bacterium]|nr:MAG: DUF1573 domain-containing protein [Desulfobulbaceae bacterium]
MNTGRQSINGSATQFKQVSNRLILLGYIIAMSFLALFLTYLPTTLYGSSGPIASISEQQYDFGEVSDGSEVEHDFLITNRGTEQLMITDVKTG